MRLTQNVKTNHDKGGGGGGGGGGGDLHKWHR